MDYLSNDYLIPVVLGDGDAATAVATYIHQKTTIRPYLLSKNHTFRQRILCRCKKLISSSEFCIVASLCDLAVKLEPLGSPLLVYTNGYEEIISDHAEEIESRYVTVFASDLMNNQKEL
ncbi:MAG: hypothetical protein IJC64_02775 [Clostridia bacterium]|nr:hypothetical protein [Clostridia bacterium]